MYEFQTKEKENQTGKRVNRKSPTSDAWWEMLRLLIVALSRKPTSALSFAPLEENLPCAEGNDLKHHGKLTWWRYFQIVKISDALRWFGTRGRCQALQIPMHPISLMRHSQNRRHLNSADRIDPAEPDHRNRQKKEGATNCWKLRFGNNQCDLEDAQLKRIWSGSAIWEPRLCYRRMQQQLISKYTLFIPWPKLFTATPRMSRFSFHLFCHVVDSRIRTIKHRNFTAMRTMLSLSN